MLLWLLYNFAFHIQWHLFHPNTGHIYRFALPRFFPSGADIFLYTPGIWNIVFFSHTKSIDYSGSWRNAGYLLPVYFYKWSRIAIINFRLRLNNQIPFAIKPGYLRHWHNTRGFLHLYFCGS